MFCNILGVKRNIMPRKEKKQLKAVFKVKIICKEQI